MSTLFANETEFILDGNYSNPFGLGYECELIQRAAKAQILKYLPELTAKLQSIWDYRDKEFIEKTGMGSYKKLVIPIVKKENIRAGIENMSLIEAPLDRWPSVLIYARNSSPYQFQADQFDTVNVTLYIEILCSEGPVKNEEIHGIEGLNAMETLDSKIQRLSDAVFLCIKKDPSLSGSIGEIEKPARVTTSLPWSRKESAGNTIGETYFLQGKQFDFTVQKLTV